MRAFPALRLGLLREHLRDERRRLARRHQVRHHAQVRINVAEEIFVTGAKIIQSRLARGGGHEAMLGAAAVAGEAHGAGAALLGQGVVLVIAELHLLRAIDGVLQRVRHDVADLVLRIDVMVARVEVAVMFHHQGRAAALGEHAQRRAQAHPAAQRDVNVLDKDRADVVQQPFVKHPRQKRPVLLGLHRPGRHELHFRFGMRRGRGGQIEPERLGLAVGHALDQRNELHERHALRLQKTVDRHGLLGVGGVDDHQRVEFHRVLLHASHPAHDGLEGGLALLVHSETVVQFARAVNAQPDQERLLGEEGAPFVIEQHAVGLDRVRDPLALRVFRLQLDDPAEEAHAQQRWLAALPGERDFRQILLLDVLADERLKHVVRQAKRLAGREQARLLKVEAIPAIEIAGRADRLDHDVKTRGRRGCWRLRRAHALRVASTPSSNDATIFSPGSTTRKSFGSQLPSRKFTTKLGSPASMSHCQFSHAAHVRVCSW